MEKEATVLDATKIPNHALKHQLIFAAFDKLKDAESFILHNDHDPVPLRHQFAAIHGADAFEWEYLEEGPMVWEVKITRKLS